MRREFLKKDTYIRFPGGECYKINGRIGEGGGSLLYSASKLAFQDGKYIEQNNLRYALKECFPCSEDYVFVRDPSGEIRPEKMTVQAEDYLRCVASMQLNEGKITSDIYETEAIRMIPILHLAGGAELSVDEGRSFQYVANTYTVMASLENKGESVASWYEWEKNLTAAAIFSVIRQILLALREVHQGNYVHLDIQDGNIFVTGDWRDQSLTCFLIDFGSARKLLEDGRCAPAGEEPVFSSQGYRAPEITRILTGEEKEFHLGKEADLYSVGYLLLYLLTGEHYSTEILESFRSKYDRNYLTRKNMQNLKVPAYVEELIQHILAKALEPDPVKRYADTDDMLKDIAKVLEALMPSHSRVSGLAYDAYILYRADDPIQKMAAQTLQKKLEHFRTPGLRRIRRVFLDCTEVSADANGDKQSIDALKASEYLIVVGGTNPDDAIWQAKEIRFFLRFHPASHVLVMLAEQWEKPEEMPLIHVTGLGRNPVLAADARGISEKEIRKKIKKDASLRIAAPILSVPYDGLVQRYKKYRRRKFGSIAAAIAVTMTGFGAHAAYQAYQIRIQHALASQNRALNLCTQALDQYEKGDRKAALETAILPYKEENIRWSIVPEQVHALNTIMGSYSSGHGTMFHALGLEKTGEEEDSFSEDSDLTVRDKVKETMLNDKIQAAIECQEAEQDLFSQMDFWEEEKLKWTPVLYDLTSGEKVCTLETQTARTSTRKGNCALTLTIQGQKRSVWGCWIGQKLWLVDLKDYSLLGELNFQSEIAAVKEYSEEEFLAGLSNGSVISVSVSGDTVVRKMVYQGNGTLYDLSCDADSQTLKLYTAEGVVQCGKPKASGMTDVDTSALFGENYEISDIESSDINEEGSYTYLWFGNTDRQRAVSGFLLEKDAVAVYRSMKEKPVFTYASEEGGEIQDIQMQWKEEDEQEYVLILETDISGKASRIRICPVDGECKTQISLPGGVEQIQYTPDLTGAYFSGYHLEDEENNSLFYMDFQTQEMRKISGEWEKAERITKILGDKTSADGDKMLTIICQEKDQIKIFSYSTSEKKVLHKQTLTAENPLESYQPGIDRTSNEDGKRLLIYDRSGCAWVLNEETLEVLYSLNTGKKDYLSMSFFRDGTCLLGADEDSVWLYDLEKEKIESTYVTSQINCSESKELLSDDSGPFFGFRDAGVYEDTATDNGISTNILHLYWVDDSLQIHAYADVEGGFKAPDNWAVVSEYADHKGFAYGDLYEFDELCERAEEILNQE